VPYTSDHFKRWSILLTTTPLPRPLRVRLRESALRRMEIGRARRAALLIVGHPKSGNTWLRTMLSRLYQVRHGLASDFVVKTDELHLRDPRIPPILATNAHYSYEGIVGEQLDAAAPRGALHAKPVVLLARHPCDIAVSWYVQFTRRQSAFKNELINHFLRSPVERSQVALWDFVRHEELGVPFLVDYLNRWERNLTGLSRSLVVRYEDLRSDTTRWLREITQLMGADFDEAEIADAVSFASFDHLRALEAGGHFGRGGLKRRRGGDPAVLKTRRGQVGGYRDDLSPARVAELDALVTERLSPSFGYGPMGEVRKRVDLQRS
jgi:hypothetical protein